MTNSPDMAQLLELAQAELNRRQVGQEFLLGDVCNITRQAYEKYREDAVIRQFAFVIEQMLEKNGPGFVISQAQISSIYNDLVRTAGNNKFREALGMFLLNQTHTKTASADNDFVRQNRVDASDSQLSTDDFVDQNLVGTLVRAFGGEAAQPKAYNEKAAEIGKDYVELELTAMGYKKPRIEIMGGDATTLVYSAHIATEKGVVSVAIPIELSAGRVLLPSTFVADDHLEELTAQKFQYFVDKKAFNGSFSVPSVDGVVKAVRMITGLEKTASSEEFKVDLANIERYDERGEKVHLSNPGLFTDRQNHPEPRPYIDTTPKVEMPKELAHLAHDFENDLLEAVSAFGKDAVNAGKQVVLAELGAAGFKNSQVRFGSESGNSVVYLAAFHTPTGPVEIEVPVEMKSIGSGYTPLAPACFGYDGMIEDFTAPKLQRFAIRRPAASTGTTVYSTAHSYMNIQELRDEIVKAATHGDYVSAEMILGSVQERYGDESYKNAIADYQYILMHNQRKVDDKVCSKMIAAGQGSIEPRCGHFGVPMSKVVTAEDGNCQLRSHIEKARLNPLNEGGAAISTNKLFWS